jgi:RNA polymerase sigma-70 factor (ECF subfamily)
MDDDSALVAEAAAGDRGACEELVTRYTGIAWRVAYSRLHDDEAAEDAVQETWAKALPKLKSFQGRAKFSTWLCTICNRVCVDHQRKAAKLGKIISITELAEQRTASGNHDDDRIALVDAVKALPARLRNAYELVEIAQIPAVDAAKILGLRPTTLRTQVTRAKESLLELLTDAYPDRCKPTPIIISTSSAR